MELMEALDTYIPLAGARHRQAFLDADRGRVLDLGSRDGGDGSRGTWEGEGRGRARRSLESGRRASVS